MSYHIGSEIYLARHDREKSLIKIGETTNSRRRRHSLIKDGYSIIYSINIEDYPYNKHLELAKRRFIESYLRLYLNDYEMHQLVYPIENTEDYFQCKDEFTADKIITELQNVLISALNASKAISRTPLDKFLSTVPQNFPEEKKDILIRIFAAIEKDEKFDGCFNLKMRYVDIVQTTLNNYYKPLGYNVEIEWCGPWTYFTITKNF